MNRRDQLIVVGVVAVAALGIFYLGLLKPKVKQSQSLGHALVAAQARLAKANASVATAQAAQASYVSNVTTINSLLPAVPPTDSTSDLLRQIDAAATAAHVSFETITLGNAAAGGPPATGAAAGGAPAVAASTPAAAAKAVGTAPPPSIPPGYSGTSAAGVPSVSYALTFKGGYLKLRQFLAALQGFVSVGANGAISAHGRLLTVPGVTISNGSVSMSVTGYLLGLADQSPLPVPQNAPAVPGIVPASTRPAQSATTTTKVAATTGAHS